MRPLRDSSRAADGAVQCGGVSSFINCPTSIVAGGKCGVYLAVFVSNGAALQSTITTSDQYQNLQACDLGPTAADKIADMSLLWGLFLGAAIAIFLVRKMLNIWDTSPHGS